MPLPVAPFLANAVVVSPPFDAQSPFDGAASALLTVLAPLWPALEPWLIAGSVVVVMGVATEIVVRELRRGS